MREVAFLAMASLGIALVGAPAVNAAEPAGDPVALAEALFQQGK